MLVRFDPFREFDRMTEEAFRPTRVSRMPMDAYRRGDVFVVHFDLPGVDPDTIDLTVEQNTLTVTAERTWPSAEGDELVITERPQGTFSRQLLIPVAEQSKARKVQVAQGGGPEVIEATSSVVGDSE